MPYRFGLKRPQEVVSLLEVGTNGLDLVDEVFDASDSDLAESGFDDPVVGEWDSLFVDLAVPSRVDELSDDGVAGDTVGDVRLDHSEHVHDWLVGSKEHGVVELSESQEL